VIFGKIYFINIFINDERTVQEKWGRFLDEFLEEFASLNFNSFLFNSFFTRFPKEEKIVSLSQIKVIFFSCWMVSLFESFAIFSRRPKYFYLPKIENLNNLSSQK